MKRKSKTPTITCPAFSITNINGSVLHFIIQCYAGRQNGHRYLARLRTKKFIDINFINQNSKVIEIESDDLVGVEIP